MITHSVLETQAFASQWISERRPGDIIALVGPLGAGKTCFVKGCAQGLGVPSSTNVNSPTFILLNIYQGRCPIYHFDWYRLTEPSALDGLGLEEYFEGEGISIVEWADKFPAVLPARTIWVRIAIMDATKRRLEIATIPNNTKNSI